MFVENAAEVRRGAKFALSPDLPLSGSDGLWVAPSLHLLHCSSSVNDVYAPTTYNFHSKTESAENFPKSFYEHRPRQLLCIVEIHLRDELHFNLRNACYVRHESPLMCSARSLQRSCTMKHATCLPSQTSQTLSISVVKTFRTSVNKEGHPQSGALCSEQITDMNDCWIRDSATRIEIAPVHLSWPCHFETLEALHCP